MEHKNVAAELIHDSKRGMEAAKAAIKAVRANAKHLNRVGRLCKSLYKAGRICSPLFVNRSGDAAGGMYVYFRIENVDGFNVPSLRKVLERFENLGIEFHKSRDYAADGYRVYEGADAHGVRVEASVYLKNDAARCRRVLKSVKKIDSFEYEFVCS